jgi:hypothetical protein
VAHVQMRLGGRLRAQEYASRWMARRGSPPEDCTSCVFDISQNPHARLRWTTRAGELPTTTTKSVWWVPALQRWLLPLEVAAASGFPVIDELARAGGIVWTPVVFTASQMGNVMHVANVGCVVAAALSCCGPA